MSRLAEKIHAAVRLDGRVELSAMDALAARNALDAMERALRIYVATFPAFRSKPIGAPNSSVRADQQSHIAMEDMARAALAKLEADNG